MAILQGTIQPTLKFITLGYIAAALLGLAGVVSWVQTPGLPAWILGLCALPLLWPAQRHIRRQFTCLTMQGDKLRYESGFLSRKTRTIQLSKVQDVTVDQSLAQRLVGIGDLSIETAGETSRLTVHNIDAPQAVADSIIDAAHKGQAHSI